MFEAPAIPTPPDTVNAPFDVVEDAVAFEIVNTPPMLEAPAIPTPPVTTSAPVDVLADAVALESVNTPSMYAFLATANPPLMVRAPPLVELLASVVDVRDVAPLIVAEVRVPTDVIPV